MEGLPLRSWVCGLVQLIITSLDTWAIAGHIHGARAVSG